MISKAGYDPRTVARNIPGILSAVFPRLTPGIVALYNKSAEGYEVTAVPLEKIKESQLQKSFLFEVGFAVGEQLLSHSAFDWNQCLKIAMDRQSRFFDVVPPKYISEADKQIAWSVGENLATMVREVALKNNSSYGAAPVIPGYRWISSGYGDFSAGSTLIEVKCIATNFSAADYRQIAMYWLLSYSAAVEVGDIEWRSCYLLNPRMVQTVKVNFDEFISLVSGGRSKAEILQVFSAILNDINEL
ncbi:hypothetical protein ACEI36_07540 [Pseudomonas kielensis]|uniref:hypothetical protein n=1 Tax=Pseudomonas kielensis TaxID=2762577 RepID=UPI0038A5A9CC